MTAFWTSYLKLVGEPASWSWLLHCSSSVVLKCNWEDGVSPPSLAWISWSLRTQQCTSLDAQWDFRTYKSFQNFVHHSCSCSDLSSWKIGGKRSKFVIYCQVFQAFFFFLSSQLCFLKWTFILLLVCSCYLLCKLHLGVLVLLLCCNVFSNGACT